MQAIVKISWRDRGDVWVATLVTTDGDSYLEQSLAPGTSLEMEVADERRCIGYHDDIGDRRPCPRFAAVETGSQCAECQGKDVYSGYVRGQEGAAVEAEYSVYLAQIGTTIKVGVTRSESLYRRWIEQGADYGAELESGLTSTRALERERQLSRTGIPERIRKEEKLDKASQDLLTDILEDIEVDTPVHDLRELTAYPQLQCSNLTRTGRAVGSVTAVKGQIIQINELCLACTPGRIIQEPSQQGLTDYT